MDQAQQLRNIIKNQGVPQRPLARIITVTSGKGGVGKSNVAINLAVQFRKNYGLLFQGGRQDFSTGGKKENTRGWIKS